jgi:glycosyltransferase involved in cell wall biosynthesis
MAEHLVFLSVVPSPYQRDTFTALARRPARSLRVLYLEATADDSPWPKARLNAWETVLPGLTLGRGTWRSHLNWDLPRPQLGEFWVVNGAMTDVTTQRVMRQLGSQTPWCFWGELPSRPKTRCRAWLQRRQYAPLAKARALVAVGERARDAYRQMLPRLPVFNQPYACELDSFAAAARHRSPNAEPVFLFCGQMVARKGIDLLLSAFHSLVSNGHPIRLELIGREAELPALLHQLPEATRRRVTYRGFLPPMELPAAFAKADVFVLPSRRAGWGVVVNQALGSGLPVICSDGVGAAHDLITSGKNGLVVPAGDPAALATAMQELALSAPLRARLGQAATLTAETLSPERAAAFWADLADQLSVPA